MGGLNSATLSFQDGGMLGKIKLPFQLDLIAIRLNNKIPWFTKEQCGKHSLRCLNHCSLQQKNYNEAAPDLIDVIDLGS